SSSGHSGVKVRCASTSKLATYCFSGSFIGPSVVWVSTMLYADAARPSQARRPAPAGNANLCERSRSVDCAAGRRDGLEQLLLAVCVVNVSVDYMHPLAAQAVGKQLGQMRGRLGSIAGGTVALCVAHEVRVAEIQAVVGQAHVLLLPLDHAVGVVAQNQND